MKYIQEIYNRIIKETAKFGMYHKCLFHLHTPASKDDYVTLEQYRTNPGKRKNKIPHGKLVELCRQKNLFNMENVELITDEIFNTNKVIYKNIDEMLKYLLIAWELTINKIELAVISDHNVITGYKPLNRAISIICERYSDVIKQNDYIAPYLILGTEISCADKNHVVGIFDEKLYSEIEQFLKDNIMSDRDGTYLTSSNVIEEIDRMGGIAYIAHADTSDMFRGGFLSNAYTTNLLNMPALKAVGFSCTTKDKDNSRNRVKNFIREKTDKEYAFLLDADSHSIDTIKGRHFYIKGQKCRFNMIKEAILDHDIAISFDMPKEPECYIRGIYISNKNNKAFLTSNEKYDGEYFSLPMSTSLNCIIGGRGTGKSTILNIIEAVLGQNFLDENVLNAIFEYDEIWVLYLYKGNEYLIGFIPRPPEYEGDDAYSNYKIICNDEKLFSWSHYDFKHNLNKLKPRILDDCVQVFEIKNGIEQKEIGNRILRKFYDMSYSVNELVKAASGKELNEYIYRILGMNPDFKTRKEKIYDKTSLRKFLDKYDARIKKREQKILDEISGFNNSCYAVGKIRIKYEIKDDNWDRFKLNDIFFDFREVKRVKNDKYILGTNLSLDGAIGFLWAIIKKYGNVHFAKMIIDESLIDKDGILLKYTTRLTTEMTENDLSELNDLNKQDVLKKINKFILDKKLINIIDGFGDDYVREIESFCLEFNVMNKEGLRKQPIYRDVRQLSLGQKVVAMLSFVLDYSDYTHDYRPLVIDQPEDNLDNQYVFKNLVDSLRNIRGNRQIIIATHSATIVTNAKAEQVIVMESDGEHGWVAAKGYVTERGIKQHIINYMEGGATSFKHKMNIYKDVLKF